MKEDKKWVCSYLYAALKATRHCSDLEDLIYYPDTEEVIAVWENGSRKVINVACDSGWAMIKDIMRALE